MGGLVQGYNDSAKTKDWSHFAKSIWDFYDAGIGDLPGFTMSPTQLFPGDTGREFFGKLANMTVDATQMAAKGAVTGFNALHMAAWSVMTAVVTGIGSKAKKDTGKDNPEQAE